MAIAFETIRLSHNVSKNASEAFWDFFVAKSTAAARILSCGQPMPRLRAYEARLEESLPVTRTTALYRKHETGQSFLVKDVQTLPKEPQGQCTVWTKSYIRLEDILLFHNRVHRRDCKETSLVLATDGVSQSKSTSASLDVFTVEFPSCHNVYPLAICKVFPSSALTKQDLSNNVMIAKKLSNEVLEQFSVELRRCGLTLNYIKCDAPKRAFVRNAQGHNSYYACDYCKAKAEKYVVKRKNADKKDFRKRHKLVWSSREVGEARSHEETVALAQEELPPQDRFGIKGPSVLCAFDSFDIIKDVPVEAMHFLSLGVIKSVITLALGAAPKKSLNKIAKFDEGKLNESLVAVKVPREFGRVTRPLDIGFWKASEFR